MRIFRERDYDAKTAPALRTAVLGYGNQGRAHALNLRDSGFPVAIGQRPGRGFDRALADGFKPHSIPEAVAQSELLILALPDEAASGVYIAEIAPRLTDRHTLGFIHGFNIRFGFINPPPIVDVIMVAPKGPGTLLRDLYTRGLGLPALAAVEQNPSGRAFDKAMAWAAGLGSLRAAVVETTFAVETETDLFGEQAVLCGGVSALTQAAFETLVEAGYPPEMAYLECVHELKQTVDLLYEGGLAAMREKISNTAEYGDRTRGPRIIDAALRARLREVLAEIRDGRFAREWMAEYEAGLPNLASERRKNCETPFEAAGRFVRSLMPWLERG